MTKTSLADLREEMRSVARGERNAAPVPAGPLLACLARDSLDMLAVLLRDRPVTVSDLATRMLPFASQACTTSDVLNSEMFVQLPLSELC